MTPGAALPPLSDCGRSCGRFRQRSRPDTSANALGALFRRTLRPSAKPTWRSLWERVRSSADPLGSPFGGERSEVAVVNDGPVDRQSRDRARRSALAQG